MRKHSLLLGIAFLSSSIFHTSFAGSFEDTFNVSESATENFSDSSWFVTSPDGQSHAFVIPEGRSWEVVKDGKKIPGFTVEVFSDAFTEGGGNQFITQYSPDGKSFAFIGRKKDMNNQSYDPLHSTYMIKDGVPSKGYLSISESSLLYSPDGKVFSFTASDGSGMFVVKNGVEGLKRYDWISSISYRPNSNIITFIGTRNHDIFFVSDGVETKVSGMDIDDRTSHKNAKYHYSYTIDWSPGSPLAFSPDNKDYAFIVRRSLSPGSTDTDQYYLVKNGVIGKEATSYDHIQYSSKDKDFILIGEKDAFDPNKNQTAWGLSQRISPSDYQDGKSPPIISGINYKSFVMKDGVSQKEYDEVFGLYYSHDCKNLAYIGLNQPASFFLVKNGMEIGKYDSIKSYAFSQNIEHYALVTSKNDKPTLIVDGFETLAYKGIKALSFSNDEKILSFLATKNGKSYFVKLSRKNDTVGDKPDPAEKATLNTPVKDFKIITEAQKASLEKQVHRLTTVEFYALATKINTALEAKNLTDAKKNLLKDVLYLLYISIPSDATDSRETQDGIQKSLEKMFGATDDKTFEAALNMR